jgi:flavin-binding protein dodecin
MSDAVYSKLELVGTSNESIEDAIGKAVAAATKQGHTVDWVEVIETRASVREGVVKQFQVVLKAGVRLPV